MQLCPVFSVVRAARSMLAALARGPSRTEFSVYLGESAPQPVLPLNPQVQSAEEQSVQHLYTAVCRSQDPCMCES